MDATRYRKPSPFIRLADLQKETVMAVIEDTREADVYNPYRSVMERKLVLYLEGGRKFVLDGSNLETVISALGGETNRWVGSRVRLSMESRGGRAVKRIEVIRRLGCSPAEPPPDSEQLR
jgi:hypothetical protein